MSLLVSQALRKPYDGLERKLIIAFDVGTTFSGVSYALLIPREPPVFQGVTQFPGQQKVGSDSKIPSVVCYDQGGNVVAVGPETDIDTNPELMEVEGLVRAEWFKLHLRPPHLAAEQRFNAKSVPPLPRNKTVVDIFGDLLAYLHASTMRYIRERQGQDMLESVGRNIEYVLSHPNGWEGQQQSVLRRAAIIVGLVASESEASERITFVTEGEATLHFCLNKVPAALENVGNGGILIVDCGGGTIDLSTYARAPGNRYKEIAPAECLLQGSFFVTQRAQEFLTKKLAKSEFGSPDDIDIMTRYFDKTTKPNYKGTSRAVYIKFGRRESNPEFGIIAGGVKVDGTQIARFFKPAITSIIKAVEDQIRNSSIPIKAIFMAGGFATSDYLFSQLDEHFKEKGINILRPDAYLNKAVAEGAVLFKVDRAVTTRVAKYTYGVEMSCPYDQQNRAHRSRRKKCFSGPSGERFLPNVFSVILEKGTEVSEEGEFRKSYINEYSEFEFKALNIETMMIKCYRGREGGSAPAWIDDSRLFPDLCMITADLHDLKKTIEPQFRGKTIRTKFYEVEFDVILFFGLTELKAQIAWMQYGRERRGPAFIVYDIASQTVGH